MGKAAINIETYDDGEHTRISYNPVKINQYTVIGILYQLIKCIEASIDKNQLKAEREPKM